MKNIDTNIYHPMINESTINNTRPPSPKAKVTYHTLMLAVYVKWKILNVSFQQFCLQLAVIAFAIKNVSLISIKKERRKDEREHKQEGLEEKYWDWLTE